MSLLSWKGIMPYKRRAWKIQLVQFNRLITKVYPYYCSYFNELVYIPYRTVTYPYLTLKTTFSKTLRYKLKVNIYSYWLNLVLSEYNFTFNFCLGVLEKLIFRFWLGYGSVRYVDRFGETTVLILLWKYSICHKIATWRQKAQFAPKCSQFATLSHIEPQKMWRQVGQF